MTALLQTSGFDTVADSVREAWAWWIALVTLLTYELWALWTQAAHRWWPAQYPGAPKPSFLITLSRMVWRAQAQSVWIKVAILVVVSWLIPHFFITHSTWPDEAIWWAVCFAVLFALSQAADRLRGQR